MGKSTVSGADFHDTCADVEAFVFLVDTELINENNKRANNQREREQLFYNGPVRKLTVDWITTELDKCKTNNEVSSVLADAADMLADDKNAALVWHAATVNNNNDKLDKLSELRDELTTGYNMVRTMLASMGDDSIPVLADKPTIKSSNRGSRGKSGSNPIPAGELLPFVVIDNDEHVANNSNPRLSSLGRFFPALLGTSESVGVKAVRQAAANNGWINADGNMVVGVMPEKNTTWTCTLKNGNKFGVRVA